MFRTIIVGAGSAGSVLAHRLSERSADEILLIEAGPDAPPGEEHPDIRDGYAGRVFFHPLFHWAGLRVTTQPVSAGVPSTARMYSQGRVVGGGSSINGQLANRGAPTDYAEWVARGAAGWGWDDVLPYFRRVERDADFADAYHGRDGRMPVTRVARAHRSRVSHAFVEACGLAGYRELPDQNGAFTDGCFATTFFNESDERVSAARAYLDRDTRKRANLRILTDTHVTALLFEGARCVGVQARRGGPTGEPRELRADEVILACGAIHSPAHLLRAGIGPADHLQAMGIPVRAALAGVGQRLMDHPSIALSSFIRPEARMQGETRRHFQVALRYSSGIAGAPAGDMYCAALSRSAWHAVGAQIASLLTFVNKTYSEAGEVRLASTDPFAEPIVAFNLLTDRRDLDRLVDGFRRMAALQLSAPLAAVTGTPFPASFSDRVFRLGVVNARNRALTALAAALMDGPAWLRRHLIDRHIVEGFTFDMLMRDPAALEAYVRQTAIGVWHASCTCRMGRPEDPMSVVDTEGRVRGVAGLRVVDASIFPVVPCANTNFPTLMVAEKIADQMGRSPSIG